MYLDYKVYAGRVLAYPIAMKRSRVILWFFIALLLFPFLYIFNASLLSADHSIWMIGISIIGSCLVTFLYLGVLIETFAFKVTTHTDHISSHTFFKTRDIYYRDIKGYRLRNHLIIEANNTERITIPNSFEYFMEMRLMMAENFEDLDQKLGNEHDNAFFAQAGELTDNEKEKYITRAKRIKKGLDITIGVLFIISFFHISQYAELMLHLSIFVYFYLSYSDRSLIRIHFRQTELPNSLYSIWVIMMLSGLLLLYKVIDHQDLARYLIFVIASSCILFVLLFITANLFNQEVPVTQVFGFLFLTFSMMFFYSMNFVSLINTMGEQHILHTNSYTIINKDYSSGGRRSISRYYFDLKSASGGVLENIDVPSRHYSTKQVGDDYQIHTYKGNLGIAWTQTNGY